MKWMRRFLALALACLLLAGTCAGCAKTEGGTDAQETGETEQAAETGFSDAGTTESTMLEDTPSFKFGFIHTSFSDQLGIMYQKYAQYAADQLGCEIIFTGCFRKNKLTSKMIRRILRVVLVHKSQLIPERRVNKAELE